MKLRIKPTLAYQVAAFRAPSLKVPSLTAFEIDEEIWEELEVHFKLAQTTLDPVQRAYHRSEIINLAALLRTA